MLDEITLKKLYQLKLTGMVHALEHLQKSQAQASLTFQEGLGFLLDYEINHRDSRRLLRLTKQARLRYPHALIEDINYEHKRAIPADEFRTLCQGQWLINHQNIVLIGPTGIGKTYLACALAQLACRRGITTRYFRLSKLLELMRLAAADGSYAKLTSQLLTTQCLVIDDWGIEPITPERQANLLEIIDDRYDKRSMIIASQLPVQQWHDYLGDPTIADAILDRVIHQATIVSLKGESMRKK